MVDKHRSASTVNHTTQMQHFVRSFLEKQENLRQLNKRKRYLTWWQRWHHHGKTEPHKMQQQKNDPQVWAAPFPTLRSVISQRWLRANPSL